MEKDNYELKSALAEEKKKNEELSYMREQDNIELTKMEKDIMKLSSENNDFKKQIDLSGSLLEDKLRRIDELNEQIIKVKGDAHT